MMKIITITAFLIVLQTFAHGQNLVPNPSFELYSNCPANQGQIYFCLDWSVTANSGFSTPDYFNACATGQMAVPSNVAGYQYPYHGNGYIGLFCYGDNSVQREYAQVQLSQPLGAGLAYRVSFFVSIADNFSKGIKSLGAYLSNNPVTGNGTMGVIDVIPQVLPHTVLYEYTNWMEVSDIYCAQGGEEYLTIGNFTYDSLSSASTVNPFGVFNLGYYYIDSVSVSLVNSSSSETVSSCESYTWPVNSTIYWSSGIYDTTLTNIYGCDSVVTLNLSINTVNSAVTQAGAALSADEPGATYQWLECPAMLPISGAIDQSFIAPANGDYAVVVTKNGCSVTSSCYTVIGVGLNENRFFTSVNISPNPNTGEFFITLGASHSDVSVAITDISGRLILSNHYDRCQLIPVYIEEPAGIYILSLRINSEQIIVRLVKE